MEKYTFTGMYPDLSRLRFGSLVHSLLSDPGPEIQQQRDLLDALVARADASGWLDIESLGRLRAGDDAVVLSILDELAIASWLEHAGYALEFNPPGASGRVGELLLQGPAGEFWLEVKTLLPSGPIIAAQTTQALIASIAATIPIPALLTLEIAHHPEGGIGRRELRRYLETAAIHLLSGAPPPAAYTHSAGLYVRALGCQALNQPMGLQVAFNTEPWPGERELVHRLWHERLWRALRGGYSQLPHSGPPTLIIVVDHTDPAPHVRHWLDPLGELLRMGQHRYLSAIGRLRGHDLWRRDPDLTLFLNPRSLAAFPELPLAQLEQRVCLLPPDGGSDLKE